MPYSERAYFDNDHCAHCATRDDHLRNERIRKKVLDAVGGRG